MSIDLATYGQIQPGDVLTLVSGERVTVTNTGADDGYIDVSDGGYVCEHDILLVEGR